MAQITTIVVAALALLVAPGAALAAWDAHKAAKVDTLVRRFLEPHEGKAVPPALSISLGSDGEMVLAKGFGHARHGLPATEQTVYHIGSLTKQFTAAALLKLIERGARAHFRQAAGARDSRERDLRRR